MKKGFKTLICVVIVLALSMMALSACFPPAVTESIEVDRSGIPTRVYVGASVDFIDLIVKRNMSDGSVETINKGDYTLDLGGFDTDVVGLYVIKVTFTDNGVNFEKSFNIQVIERSQAEGSYFMDGETMILFVDIEYTFENVSELIIKQGNVSTPVDGKILKISEVGEYTLSYKDAMGEEKSRNIKVIDELTYFAEGESRIVYKATVQSLSEGKGEFLNKEITPYYVGTSNAFYFDIDIESSNSEKEFLPTTDILDYSFEIMTDGEWNKVETKDICEITDDYMFTFKKSLEGKRIRATIEAKYKKSSDSAKDGYHNFAPINVEFMLNDGYNVFSHNDLQKYYAALYVHNINIHRNIETYFVDNQLNPDGTPKNINGSAIPKYVEYNSDGDLVANNTASSYVRVNTNSSDDKLVINGNYFTIDASKLKLIVPDNENKYPDQPGSLGVAGAQTDIVNSQSSLFYAKMHSEGRDEYLKSITIEQAKTFTSESYCEREQSIVEYNNLMIIGNTEVPRGDMSDEDVYNEIIKKSGSYSGFRSNDSHMDINNCVIKFTCIGVFATGTGAEVRVDKTYITESWANNIYGISYNLELSDSVLLAAGGSGVWLEDKDYREGEVFDCNIVIDNDTVIENYVSGTEAWFGTNGMSAFVAGAKSSLESVVAQYSNGVKTLVRTEESADGTPFEVFNFAIVVVNNYTKEPDQVIEYYSSIQFGDIKIKRLTAELNADPRNVSGIGFVAPIGSLSSTTTFVSAATAKGQEIYMKIKQGNQAMLAEVQAFMEQSGITDMQQGITQYAGFLTMATSFTEPGVKYMEAKTQTPVGELFVYTEIFDTAKN